EIDFISRRAVRVRLPAGLLPTAATALGPRTEPAYEVLVVTPNGTSNRLVIPWIAPAPVAALPPLPMPVPVPPNPSAPRPDTSTLPPPLPPDGPSPHANPSDSRKAAAPLNAGQGRDSPDGARPAARPGKGP